MLEDFTRRYLPINPKIRQKIESLSAPEEIKQLITLALETEEELEASGTQKQFSKTYDKLLDKFVKKAEVIKFCDNYDK